MCDAPITALKRTPACMYVCVCVCCVCMVIYKRFKKTYVFNDRFSVCSQSFKSFAIFEAMFLNPIDVPDIRLKRTPFNESLGNLHTSISH